MIIEENNEVQEIEANKQINAIEEEPERYAIDDFRNPETMSEVMKVYYGK